MECEIPAFYSHTEPVAKKEYRCCECRAPILPGERHFSCTGKWDGDVQSFRQHLLCMEACEFVRDKFNGDECIGFGELLNWWGESRWQSDKVHPTWIKFRSMLAAILIRKRNASRSK